MDSLNPHHGIAIVWIAGEEEGTMSKLQAYYEELAELSEHAPLT